MRSLATVAATAAVGLATVVVPNGGALAAQPLLPSQIALVLADNPTSTLPGSYSGASSTGGSESISLSAFPQPTLTANASGSDLQTSTAEGDITYFYEVVGPLSDTPINIQITGTLAINALSGGYAQAFLVAGGHQQTLLINDGTTGSKRWSGTWSFGVFANGLNEVVMDATASGDGPIWHSGYNAYAFADPVISFVGPHDGYSLIFSPGIGNGDVAGVAEPASWAIMLVGFGLAGVALRRRSRVSATT